MDCFEPKTHLFEANQNGAVKDFVAKLNSSWLCRVPEKPQGRDFVTYLEVDAAMVEARSKFEMWFRNSRFKIYIDRIAKALMGQGVEPLQSSPNVLALSVYVEQVRKPFVSIDDIFTGPAPTIQFSAPATLKSPVQTGNPDAAVGVRLGGLLSELEVHAASTYEKRYAKDLRESLAALQSTSIGYPPQTEIKGTERTLADYVYDWCNYVERLYDTMRNSVKGDAQSLRALSFATCHAPRVSPILFLQQLTRKRWQALALAWRESIISYGVAITELQRAQRLVAHANNFIDLALELANPGHQNWRPYEFPESLLFEIESGVMIRSGQEEIAGQMRNPTTNANAVMQLNMGEGKSTVIVPIVAIALANNSQLVRVIVAKPQSKQMFQILASKLGGLVDRQIYHLPFSRSIKMDESKINAIHKLCNECMTSGGILLIQPEHILSFKLMTLDRLMSANAAVGASLLRTQQFLDNRSRDVIDESDENFAVRFELVYTMGEQTHLQFSPERWIIAQKVLQLFRDIAIDLARCSNDLVELSSCKEGEFPRIRILRSDAYNDIIKRLAKQVCGMTFPGCPIAYQPEGVRGAIFTYLTEANLDNSQITQVEGANFWTDVTKGPLLLLRGLLAGGILTFAFGSKRWRVNYGLDPSRLPATKLAVPFRAKDNPTQRSEFSHPDVSIVLTLMSYYYGGLEDEELFTAFNHLLKSDQAQVEYDEWTRRAGDMPESFHQLVGVNIEDHAQCIEQVFPHLRYSQGAINYFLSHIVLPKEMKEFPYKISASGWDIGQSKTNVTTGFSGTNDSRYVLPLSINHLDLPAQKHTNALVLDYLLQPNNAVKIVPPRRRPTDTDVDIILATVDTIDPPPRVLLDVGAQILELGNHAFAEKWLKSKTNEEEIRAAVFFDDKDELSVLDRAGYIEPLQTSPFAIQLDVCLVFLDEAHTRGTDLKLPQDYRAAVTLGSNLTKDKLVQGR